MKKGFYKLIGQKLIYAPNFVCAPTFKLNKELKDTYTFPIEGWYWFNSEDEAYLFFNIQKPLKIE